MKFASDSVLNAVKSNNLTPIQYVDDQGNPTMQYPLNPNGSPDGIAALCSPDGRHLAMMPHPERCTQVCMLLIQLYSIFLFLWLWIYFSF